MRKRVLVVMPEAPYPPRKNGVALRYYPLLQRLGAIFEIDLAVVVDGEAISVELGGLRQLLHHVVLLRRRAVKPSPFRKLLAHLHRIVPGGVPFAYYDYGAAGIARQLRPVLSDDYDAVLWVALSHVLYSCLPYLASQRLIVDCIDSPTLHCIRSLPPANIIDRLVIDKTRRWEAAMVSRADVAFYISPVDRGEVKDLVRSSDVKISPNGVLIEDYTDEKAPLHSPSLGFLGNMSYRPNIDAVHRLLGIFIKLRVKFPDLSLYIIGRDPDPALLKYAEIPGVVITGTVDNIWPYVNAVSVFAMPMVMGAGQQNKILEVMFAGRPIVASSIANGGILAVDGQSILVADNDEVMQEKISSLLEDDEKRELIGKRGAKFVREKYSWDEIAQQIAVAISPED